MPGPGIVPDPTIICKHLTDIDDRADSSPNWSWTSLYHVMRHYHEESGPENSPECVELRWSDLAGGDLRKLVEAESAFRQSLSLSDSDLIQVEAGIKWLSTLATTSDSENSQSDILSGIGEIMSYNTFDYNIFAGEVMDIACESTACSLWKNTLWYVIKDWSSETLLESDISTLEITASLCADEYGDPVQWARGILAHYNQTRYDHNDDCHENVQGRERKSPIVETESVRINPNPANSFITIENFTDSKIVEVRLMDMNGTIQLQHQLSGESNEVDCSSLINGIYLLEVSTETGFNSIEKIIIQK